MTERDFIANVLSFLSWDRYEMDGEVGPLFVVHLKDGNRLELDEQVRGGTVYLILPGCDDPRPPDSRDASVPFPQKQVYHRTATYYTRDTFWRTKGSISFQLAAHDLDERISEGIALLDDWARGRQRLEIRYGAGAIDTAGFSIGYIGTFHYVRSP